MPMQQMQSATAQNGVATGQKQGAAQEKQEQPQTQTAKQLQSPQVPKTHSTQTQTTGQQTQATQQAAQPTQQMTQQSQPKKSKWWLWLIIIFGVLVVFGVVAYFIFR